MLRRLELLAGDLEPDHRGNLTARAQQTDQRRRRHLLLPGRRPHPRDQRQQNGRQRLVCPRASGCGGFLVELLLNPIISSASGLPAAAGKNTAILNNTLNVASAAAVRKNNAENP